MPVEVETNQLYNIEKSPIPSPQVEILLQAVYIFTIRWQLKKLWKLLRFIWKLLRFIWKLLRCYPWRCRLNTNTLTSITAVCMHGNWFSCYFWLVLDWGLSKLWLTCQQTLARGVLWTCTKSRKLGYYFTLCICSAWCKRSQDWGFQVFGEPWVMEYVTCMTKCMWFLNYIYIMVVTAKLFLCFVRKHIQHT